jgi:hypothetical protein
MMNAAESEDTEAGGSAAANTAGDPEEWLTQTQVAERVVALGLADSMTRQRVDQLSKSDPDWPVPKEEWRAVGVYWLLPWSRLEPYFRQRKPKPGRPKGSKKNPSPPAEHDPSQD